MTPVDNRWALRNGGHPVLVPQQSQELLIEARLEHLDFELIVLICVNTKVLNLVQGDRLVLGLFRRCGWLVAVGVSAEGADVDLSGRNGAVRVDLSRASSAKRN